jgi:hypothetical protein
VSLTRRGFIVGATTLPVVLAAPRRGWAASAPPFSFLTAHEGAVVEAATARLIPGPLDDPLEVGHPGAREAGVVHYVDALLSAFAVEPPRLFAGGPASGRHGGVDGFSTFQPLSALQDRHWRATIAEWQARYRAGVVALDAATGGDFTAAPPGTQDDALAQDATGFRELLFDHAIEGWLGDPVYGGNAGSTGWTEVAFPGDACPDGYPAEQVALGDGIDPIDPTGAVGVLLALLEATFGA